MNARHDIHSKIPFLTNDINVKSVFGTEGPKRCDINRVYKELLYSQTYMYCESNACNCLTVHDFSYAIICIYIEKS